MKQKPLVKSRLVYLESVGTLIDPETFYTYPAPKAPLFLTELWRDKKWFDLIVMCNIEIDMMEAVEFEDCSDEWFDNLSRGDMKTIIYLMSKKNKR